MTVTVRVPSTALRVTMMNDDYYRQSTMETRADQAQYEFPFRGIPQGEYTIIVEVYNQSKQVGRLERTVYKK